MNNTLITEATLQQFNNREEQAFKQIFYAFFHEMHVYSTRITQDYHESEDIVIKAFQKLWTCKHKFKTQKEIRYFLYAIVKNETLNYVRSATHKSRVSAQEISEEMDIVDYAEDQAVKNERMINLHKYIERLPKACRKVMCLHVLGYSGKQISARLGVSTDTVYTQFHRGLQKL